MFGKKLLSVVGLLFLGSQIISVEAVCTPSLTDGKCKTENCDSGNAGELYLVEDTGGKKYIAVISELGEQCTIEKGVCGVSLDSKGGYTATNCGLDYDGKLFINDGKLYEVTVELENEETGQIKRSCAPKDQTGNFCTTVNGDVVNTIEGFCEKSCVEGKPTYSCSTGGSCIKDVNPRSCKRATCKFDKKNGFSGCKDGDYLIVTEGEGLVEDETNVDGVLYKCSGESTCGKVGEKEEEKIEVGYYRNAGNVESLPYIKCYKDKEGDDMKCAPIAVASGDCSGTGSIGKLVMDKNNNDVVNICLDENISLLLEDDSLEDSEYFMQMEVTNTVFEAYKRPGEYAVVEVLDKGNEIHLVKEKDLAGNAPDMYKYSNINNRIIAKDDNDEICKNRYQIVEFKLTGCVADPDDVAYYAAKNSPKV